MYDLHPSHRPLRARLRQQIWLPASNPRRPATARGLYARNAIRPCASNPSLFPRSRVGSAPPVHFQLLDNLAPSLLQ